MQQDITESFPDPVFLTAHAEIAARHVRIAFIFH